MTPAEARQALGLSIAEMARTLRVHRSTWTKWERGEQHWPAVAETAARMLLFIKWNCLLEEWQAVNSEGGEE